MTTTEPATFEGELAEFIDTMKRESTDPSMCALLTSEAARVIFLAGAMGLWRQIGNAPKRAQEHIDDIAAETVRIGWMSIEAYPAEAQQRIRLRLSTEVSA
jgi:hypothetical protein